MTLEQVLSELYDSEINAGLGSFWDGGWTVFIGDEMNGHKAEWTFGRNELSEVAGWLERAAMIAYPNSQFTESRLGRVREMFDTSPKP